MNIYHEILSSNASLVLVWVTAVLAVTEESSTASCLGEGGVPLVSLGVDEMVVVDVMMGANVVLNSSPASSWADSRLLFTPEMAA